MMKKFDIILFGASGFTGRLVAEYFLQEYGSSNQLKWAMAGRNLGKLEKIRAELGDSSIPILLADSQDMASLNTLVQQTQVICTTVGPYAKYGSKLVEACVNQGVDYCDLTGEVQWIRRMIDQHQQAAKASGAKIVHCCGFDSIPSDMGVYFLQKEAFAQKGKYCQHIKMRVKGIKGGMSGGTYASLSNLLVEAEKDKSIFDILEHPYGLNPRGQWEGKDLSDLNSSQFDKDFQAWISPFVMAAINTKIVRRSHALVGFPYGKNFQYDEAILHGKGLSARLQAGMMAAATGLASHLSPNSIIKRVADRFLPQPGQGPSKQQREKGFFHLIFVGKMEDGSIIKAKVKGDRDPGYGSTSKMLGESALCLAKDRDKLPQINGVLTPSTAMGEPLLQRLKKKAGLTFNILN